MCSVLPNPVRLESLLTHAVTFFRIFGSDGSKELGRDNAFHKAYENTRIYGDASRIVDLPDWGTAVTKFPVLGSDPSHSEGKSLFKGIYNGNAGWVRPVEAMTVIMRECEKMGVEFAAGRSGTVKELLRADDGKIVTGVRTFDDTKWYADKIILAAGSYCDTLLDFKGQLQAVRDKSPRVKSPLVHLR